MNQTQTCTCDNQPNPLCSLHGDPRDTSLIDVAIAKGKTLTCACGHHWSAHLHHPDVLNTVCTASQGCYCYQFKAAE